MKSTNGTFVRDSRIESAVVAPGSEIRLGKTRLHVREHVHGAMNAPDVFQTLGSPRSA